MEPTKTQLLVCQMVLAVAVSLIPAGVAWKRGLRKLAYSTVFLCCFAGFFLGLFATTGLAVLLACVNGLGDKEWLRSAGEGRLVSTKYGRRDTVITVLVLSLVAVVAFRSGLF